MEGLAETLREHVKNDFSKIMIRYLTRKEINIDKYNYCIETSIESQIFALSWYLDIVLDHWGALVLDDYEAVMPLPDKRKYGIKYVYPPLWILQLGIFSVGKKDVEGKFLDELHKHFHAIELRLNVKNKVKHSEKLIRQKYHKLNISGSYDNLYSNYRKDRKKDLKKAAKFNLKGQWESKIDELIFLFQNNVGKRTPYIKAKDYENLRKLIEYCINHNCGDVLSVYDDKNNLVASGFFLKHQDSITILCSSTDFSNRNNGANTFLIDRAIQKYQSNFKTFYFGGSSIESVASYFLSFGAEELNYSIYKSTPKLLSFLNRFRK